MSLSKELGAGADHVRLAIRSFWRKPAARLALALLTLYSLPTTAQVKNAGRWYFGASAAGLAFPRPTYQREFTNDQAVPFGAGGSAVATDPTTGNLLFYTDGSRIYDAYHKQMPSGGALSGNNGGGQPVAISSIPGQNGRYYVFSNSANYPNGGNISVSVVDMTQPGSTPTAAVPSGAVINANGATGIGGRSEGMTTVPHANGTDFWLITHRMGSQEYGATLINASTYTSATAQSFTTLPSNVAGITAVANMAYSPTLKKIAVSPQAPNENALILNFDDATGAITLDRAIANTAGTNAMATQSISDIEWSPKGNYLYISIHGGGNRTADLMQYDYGANTLTSILFTPIYRSYGLQLAPDTAIYHLYQATAGGAFMLGRIKKPNEAAAALMYEVAQATDPDFEGRQFPSFLTDDKVNLMVDFSSAGMCMNAPTTFFSTVTPVADSLVWDFGDGASGRGASPIHTYKQGQTYTVTLTAFHKGKSMRVSHPVTIQTFPLSIKLVADTTACRSEFPPPRGSSSPRQFSVKARVDGGNTTAAVWSNGNMGLTLMPDSAGYYYLVVTDGSGCSTYAGVNVKEYGLEDQRANVWYFGNRAGIDFNRLPGPPVALSNSAMNAPEGTATISDRNGDVIFYTDGDKVYDKTHTEIANGIGGDPGSAQAALIVPAKNDETLYYIFTTKESAAGLSYELRYSLFDLKRNNGRGDVVERNRLLYAKSTERIIANSDWLISHEYGNNTFRAYPITMMGIGDPVFSDIGSVHSFENTTTAEGYMYLHSNDTLVVALSNPGVSNLIEVFHLNRSTGAIEDYKKIDLNEPNGQIYGIIVSPGGKKILATLKGSPTPSAVFEYYFNSMGNPVLQKRTNAPTQELGALQRGPDGQIYMAINGSSALGTVQASESTTVESTVNFSSFTLAPGTFSRLGLPNFAQMQGNNKNEPDVSFTGVCLGDTTMFTATITDAIDEVSWDFGDGNTGLSPNATHKYLAAGAYMVSMRIKNRCGLDRTITKPITIAQPAIKPTTPGAAALCTGSVTLDANSANRSGYTYLWSPSGSTAKTISVTTQSIVSVTLTSPEGCKSSAETIVSDNRPTFDLGEDEEVCAADTPIELNAGNAGATHAWSINGRVVGNGVTQSIDLNTAGVYAVQAQVTDPVTGCTVTDAKTFTVRPTPAFTLTPTDAQCNPGTNMSNGNGRLSITLNGSTPNGGPYRFTVSQSGSSSANADVTNRFNPNTGIVASAANPVTVQGMSLLAGAYQVDVTDGTWGCSTRASAPIADLGSGFTISPNITQSCNTAQVGATITEDGSRNVIKPFAYKYINHTAGIERTGTSVGAPTEQFTPGSGNYTLVVTENSGRGCSQSVTATVAPMVSVPISIAKNVCSNPRTLKASAVNASSYTWTGPGVAGPADTSDPTRAEVIVNAPGLYEVTAIVNGCPYRESEEIVFPPVITSDFSQSDACAEKIILSASPTGPYTYRWYKGAAPQRNLIGRIIELGPSENGESYAVELVSAADGCLYRSAGKAVNVSGLLDVSITPYNITCDNGPFSLVASTVAVNIGFSWFLNDSMIPNETSSTLMRNGKEGVYKVRVSKTVCSSDAEIKIMRLPIPKAGNLPEKTYICNVANPGDQASEVTLNPGTFDTYEWFKNDVSLGVIAPTLTVNDVGIYKVVYGNSGDVCTNNDETEVITRCDPVLSIPNAFRPSSKLDTNKDFHMLSFFITEEFSIQIYNRWGELVFQSNDRLFSWDGTHYGLGKASLPTGMYAYVVKYVDAFQPELGSKEKRGGVMLLR